MAYFDGRLSSIEPFISTTANEVDQLRIEFEALHQLLDRYGVERFHISNGSKLLLAQRLEKLLEAPTRWEAINRKKDDMMGV